MINGNLLHPQILASLASAGHGSRVLIADGNFPFATCGRESVPRVYLNLAPDTLTVPSVLREIVRAVPLESVMAPVPDDGSTPAIWTDYRSIVPSDIEIAPVKRFDFYNEVNSPDTALIIATGETRIYACILLVIGVR